MPRRAVAAQDPQQGVEALANLTPAPEPEPSSEWQNAGNFPDAPADEASAAPTEAPPLETEPQADAPAAAPTDDWRERYEEIDRKYAGLERELQFLRAGQQQQPPPQAPDGVDPAITQALGQLQIRPDVLESLGIPATDRNVQVVGSMFQAAAVIGAQIAEKRLLSFYQQEQARLAATQQSDQQGDALRSQFWKDNGDLEPYGNLVKAHAQDVAREHEQRPFTADQAAREVARRTRKQLADWGIRVGAQQAPAAGAQPRRLRPATAEMGGGRSNGGPAMSAVTKQIMKLAGM